MNSISFSIEFTSDVIENHKNLVTRSYIDQKEKCMVIEMDVRRDHWSTNLNLPKSTQIHWADIRKVDIKELSFFRYPIIYRLTYGDGWYRNKDGKRQYFPLQPYLRGLDLRRNCSDVVIRTAILLAVLAGIGLRGVCWLMWMVFHLEISKSSLDRWVKECAAQLPDMAGMARLLNAEKQINEAHFDEIFAKGKRPKKCTLVLRDEDGRLFAAREIDSRDEATVTQFLQDVKSWGIEIQRFFVDGCEVYRKAIRTVYPIAVIQYDYFHVIQGVFKKLRATFVNYRREVKERSSKIKSAWEKAKLEDLAKKLWEKRGLIFKNPDNMKDEEKDELEKLIEEDAFVDRLRHFMNKVWDIFTKSPDDFMARMDFELLKQEEEVQQDSKSGFSKAIAFLEERFDDMIAFLRHPKVRRNSLAETGIRCLRRLEQGHDGFRGEDGLDCYLRIFQAIKYFGWTVHRLDSGDKALGLIHVLPGQHSRREIALSATG